MCRDLRTCVNDGLLSPTPAHHECPTITEAVVRTVAEAEDVSPLDLQPLATVIDPDALEALVRDGWGNVTIKFAYQGYQVCVDGDEQVTVSDRDD